MFFISTFCLCFFCIHFVNLCLLISTFVFMNFFFAPSFIITVLTCICREKCQSNNASQSKNAWRIRVHPGCVIISIFVSLGCFYFRVITFTLQIVIGVSFFITTFLESSVSFVVRLQFTLCYFEQERNQKKFENWTERQPINDMSRHL